jgi:hypothetical protein
VSQAPFKNADKLEFMCYINQEGLKNDFLFLGIKGGFELRDPRDLTRKVICVHHESLENIRNVELI